VINKVDHPIIFLPNAKEFN